MLPGFAYGNASADNAERQRAASIVLATDNVVPENQPIRLTRR